VLFDLDGPYLGVDKIPYPVAPHKGDHHQQHQFLQPVQGDHMGVLNIEPTGFQPPEQRFHLPPLPIVFQGLVRSVKRDQDEIFYFTILDRFCPREVAQLAVHLDDPPIMPQFPDFQVVEQVPGRDLFLFSWGVHLEIVPYPDMVPDVLPAEEAQPIFPYKLPIGQQAVDTPSAEPRYKILHQCDALPRIGVPPLVQHTEHQGEGHVPVCDPQHQYVDVALPELPVCPVHHQDQGPLMGQQRKDQLCNPFHGQLRTGHKALYPPVIALGIGPGVESARKLGVIYRPDLAQGRDKMTDKTDPGKVQKTTKTGFKYR